MDEYKRRRRSVGPSARELEVLALVARGMGNAEAARALGVSEATVKRHLANVYAVVGVHSRSEAVAYALRSGLLSAGELWGRPDDGGGERYGCAEEGCGCEVAVVAAPPGGADWRPPVCHGREMRPVEDPPSAPGQARRPKMGG